MNALQKSVSDWSRGVVGAGTAFVFIARLFRIRWRCADLRGRDALYTHAVGRSPEVRRFLVARKLLMRADLGALESDPERYNYA